MKTIIALVDFSDVTEKVLAAAGVQAKAFGARVIMMHLVPKEPVVMELGLASPVVSQKPSEEMIRSDYQRLEALRDSLTQKGVDVVLEQFTEGNTEKVLDECRRWKADLIVLGSHHHSRIYDWLVGSFTSEVLKSAVCPVLVVPADATAS